MQKTMGNQNYHKEHVKEQIFSAEKRAANDSMEKQNEEFVIQSAKIAENQPVNDQRMSSIEMKEDKIRISVVEEDEFKKTKSMARDMSKFVFEKTNDIKIEANKQ